MNTAQLIQSLWGDVCARRYYGDVLAVDMLPNVPVDTNRRIFIVNTDVHTGPGDHWVLFYLPPHSPGEFFDSTGQDLTVYHPQMNHFMYLNKREYVYNEKRLQSRMASTCGHYCLYYAIHRCRGVSQDSIINSFTDDSRSNDAIVTQFVKDYFGL